MSLSAFAGGAAESLDQILKQKFIEMVQRQEMAQRQQQIEQSAARDAVQAELGRRRLGLDEEGLSLQGRKIGLDEKQFGEDTRRFNLEQPIQARLRVAQAANLEGLEGREAAGREHDMALSNLRNQHALGLESARGAQDRLTLRTRASQTPAAPPQASPYAAERTTRVRESVAALKNKVGDWTAGPGSMLASIPGTDAKNFQAELQTLKANIAFGELTEMRAASKTGGALGQVSDKEIHLLESSLGALDQAQSPANLKAQLEKIEQSLARWEAAKSGRPDASGAPPVQNMNDPKARAAELLKKYGG